MTITAVQIKSWNDEVGLWRDKVRQRDAEFERLRGNLKVLRMALVVGDIPDADMIDHIDAMLEPPANQQPQQCAECNCANPPDGCNWIKSPASSSSEPKA